MRENSRLSKIISCSHPTVQVCQCQMISTINIFPLAWISVDGETENSTGLLVYYK